MSTTKLLNLSRRDFLKAGLQSAAGLTLGMHIADVAAQAAASGPGKTMTAAALDGVIFARGPGIEPGSSPGHTSVFDIAPSVLAWLGIPIPEDMVGRPAPFLRVPDPGRVASYDDLPIERLETGGSGTETEIVEHLRALGYLEEEEGVGEPEEQP